MPPRIDTVGTQTEEAVASVHIHNKRSQKLVVSVLDTEGHAIKLVLQPRELSAAIPSEQVGAYTHKLARLGHVRLRPAK